MKTVSTNILWLSSLGLLCSPWLSAQVCQVSNFNLTGSYGYVASEPGAASTTSSGSGTTGTTGTTGSSGTGTTTGASSYSSTPLGSLLGGISSGNQFAVGGLLVFDGAGNIDAASSTTGGSVMPVGTYNVNSDCSITVSLHDAFGSTTTPTNLVGVVLGGGAEIDLTSTATVMPAATAGTTGTGTSSTGTPIIGATGTSTSSSAQMGPGLSIKLSRVYSANGCSVATLHGPYGFVLNPVAAPAQTSTMTSSTGSTTVPVSTTGGSASAVYEVIGDIVFDGAGHVIAPNPVVSSSTSSAALATLQYTGTYSVNSDCSGTMKLSNMASSSTTSSSGTGTSTSGTGTTGTGTSGTGTTGTGTTGTGGSVANQTYTISFVITSPSVTLQPGGSNNLGTYPQFPGLDLSFSTSTESGWGYALAQ